MFKGVAGLSKLHNGLQMWYLQFFSVENSPLNEPLEVIELSVNPEVNFGGPAQFCVTAKAIMRYGEFTRINRFIDGCMDFNEVVNQVTFRVGNLALMQELNAAPYSVLNNCILSSYSASVINHTQYIVMEMRWIGFGMSIDFEIQTRTERLPIVAVPVDLVEDVDWVREGF